MQAAITKEQIDSSKIPQEAIQALKILNELENFTADLRKKLMTEIRPETNIVRLKLDDV